MRLVQRLNDDTVRVVCHCGEGLTFHFSRIPLGVPYVTIPCPQCQRKYTFNHRKDVICETCYTEGEKIG